MLKKGFLFSLILSLSLSNLISQDWPIGTKWVYNQWEFFPYPGDSYRQLEVVGDTVISGTQCSVISESLFRIDNDVIYYESINIREHILSYLNQKIFYYRLEDSTFYLLYDFTAQIGDTLTIYTPDAIWDDYDLFIDVFVVEIDSINIDGQNLKTLRLQHNNHNDYFTMAGWVTEDIGWSNYLFPQHTNADPPFGGSLYCFTNTIIQWPDFRACDLITSQKDTFSQNEFRFIINNCVFTSSHQYDELQVINLLGQVIRKEKNIGVVSLSGLKGLFVLSVRINERRHSKLVYINCEK